ncbi:MAG: hypothetical protein ACRCUM_01575 [Mycoplasmoidaceae bacterium]
MNRKGKKELLNNWQNMSIEERESKLVELESTLSEKKFKKIVSSIKKIENSLKDDSISNSDINENIELDTSTNENYDKSSEVENFDESNQEESHEYNNSNVEDESYFENKIDENIEDNSKVEEEILDDENDNQNFDESLLNNDDISIVEDEELNQNWIIDEDELNVETNFDDNISLDNQMFESEIDKKYVPVDFGNIKTDYKKEQIGSSERAWNKNKDIIYSQEELIYRLSNSTNINDDEYRMLLISAQKKIEFIQLLIEKSRVKNAAYSYDFLNSMCWRVDKALKTFLAANKR